MAPPTCVLQRGDRLVLRQGGEEHLATVVGDLVVAEAGAQSTQSALERGARVSHRSTSGRRRSQRRGDSAYSRSCRVRFAWMVAPSATAPASPTLRPKTLGCANAPARSGSGGRLAWVPSRPDACCSSVRQRDEGRVEGDGLGKSGEALAVDRVVRDAAWTVTVRRVLARPGKSARPGVRWSLLGGGAYCSSFSWLLLSASARATRPAGPMPTSWSLRPTARSPRATATARAAVSRNARCAVAPQGRRVRELLQLVLRGQPRRQRHHAVVAQCIALDAAHRGIHTAGGCLGISAAVGWDTADRRSSATYFKFCRADPWLKKAPTAAPLLLVSLLLASLCRARPLQSRRP